MFSPSSPAGGHYPRRMTIRSHDVRGWLTEHWKIQLWRIPALWSTLGTSWETSSHAVRQQERSAAVSQLAGPLWADPDPENGIGVSELICTMKKSAGGDWFIKTLFQESLYPRGKTNKKQNNNNNKTNKKNLTEVVNRSDSWCIP